MTAIAFSPAVGPVPIDCIVKLSQEQSLEITQIPVEAGATITDHALLLPRRVELEVFDEDAAATWAALAALQESRVPFTIVTGLAVFSNMLIEANIAERTAHTSHVFDGKILLQEIIQVSQSTSSSPAQASTGPQGAAAGIGGSSLDLSIGLPGGLGSVVAAVPVPDIVSDIAVAARAATTIVRGPSPVSSIGVSTGDGAGILQQVFG